MEKTKTPLSEVDLSDQACYVLLRLKVTTVEEVAAMSSADTQMLYSIGSRESIPEIQSLARNAEEIIRQCRARREKIAERAARLGNLSIDSLDLSARSRSALHSAGIHTAGGMIRMSRHDVSQLHAIGRKSSGEILAAIHSFTADIPVVRPDGRQVSLSDGAGRDPMSRVQPEPGTAGGTGKPGKTGKTGTAGSTEAVGTAGKTAVTGAAGKIGKTGTAGSTGAVRTAGKTAVTGAAGKIGKTGTAGSTGTVGTAGKTAVTGAAGTRSSRGTSPAAGQIRRGANLPESILNTSVERLQFTDGVRMALRRANIHTIRDLLQEPTSNLLKMWGIGIKKAEEIQDVLEEICRKGDAFADFRTLDRSTPTKTGNAAGKAEAPGTAGAVGTAGKAGVPGTAGAVGTAGKAGVPGTAGAVGTAGKAGVPGTADTRNSRGMSSAAEQARRGANLPEWLLNTPVGRLRLTGGVYMALQGAHIHTIRDLLQEPVENLTKMRGIGIKKAEDLQNILGEICRKGAAYTGFQALDGPAAEKPSSRQIDIKTIRALRRRLGVEPATMADWFHVSEEGLKGMLRSGRSSTATWTGGLPTFAEMTILREMMDTRVLCLKKKDMQCLCLNDGKGDFACLFLSEKQPRCFFRENLPQVLQRQLAAAGMNRLSQDELDGCSSGIMVHVLRSPRFRPDRMPQFQENAAARKMDEKEYAVFLTGCPLCESPVTDDQVIAYFESRRQDGVVHLSAADTWIHAHASRNGYSLPELAALFGCDAVMEQEGSRARGDTRSRHRALLQPYVVDDTEVYLPEESSVRRLLHACACGRSMELEEYLYTLGFRLLSVPSAPDRQAGPEPDMQVRTADENHVVIQTFVRFPLLGSRILRRDIMEQLIASSEKLISQVLDDRNAVLSPAAKMQITLTLIHFTEEWTENRDGDFWTYISLQYGYLENNIVTGLLQACLRDALQQNQRLILTRRSGRTDRQIMESRLTLQLHALAPKKAWYELFDFLLAFYCCNLNRQISLDDPLPDFLLTVLRERMENSSDEETVLTVGEDHWSFHASIRSLILLRPAFTGTLFRKLLLRMDALIQHRAPAAVTREEQLCDAWFAESPEARLEDSLRRTGQTGTVGPKRPVSSCACVRAEYVLERDRTVCIALPEIRLLPEDSSRVELQISLDGGIVYREQMDRYGNELGWTLRSVSIPLDDCVPPGRMDMIVTLRCRNRVLYCSGDSLFRRFLLFSEGREVPLGKMDRLRPGRYAFLAAADRKVRTFRTVIKKQSTRAGAGLQIMDLILNEESILCVDDLPVYAPGGGAPAALQVRIPDPVSSMLFCEMDGHACRLVRRGDACTLRVRTMEDVRRFAVCLDGERVDAWEFLPAGEACTAICRLPLEGDRHHLQVFDQARRQPVHDQYFLLAERVVCCFNQAFYLDDADYRDASFSVQIDGFSKDVSFSPNDRDVIIPFRGCLLRAEIPHVRIRETTGTWFSGPGTLCAPAAIPENSRFQITVPEGVTFSLLTDTQRILPDRDGGVDIGSILHALEDRQVISLDADVEHSLMRKRYSLAKITCREQFQRTPRLWTEGCMLCWDRGGGIIGYSGRPLLLMLDDSTDCHATLSLNLEVDRMPLPQSLKPGFCRFTICFADDSGSGFQWTEQVLARGEFVLGDEDALRFQDARLVLESVTDSAQGTRGRIPIQPCCIDRIEFLGIWKTRVGRCPVYQGILSRPLHPNRSSAGAKGRSATDFSRINPIRLTYVNDRVLYLTDRDGQPLHYTQSADRRTGAVVCSIVDALPDAGKEHRFPTVDLCMYRIV